MFNLRQPAIYILNDSAMKNKTGWPHIGGHQLSDCFSWCFSPWSIIHQVKFPNKIPTLLSLFSGDFSCSKISSKPTHASWNLSNGFFFTIKDEFSIVQLPPSTNAKITIEQRKTLKTGQARSLSSERLFDFFFFSFFFNNILSFCFKYQRKA